MDQELYDILKPFMLQLVMMLLQGLDAYLAKRLGSEYQRRAGSNEDHSSPQRLGSDYKKQDEVKKDDGTTSGNSDGAGGGSTLPGGDAAGGQEAPGDAGEGQPLRGEGERGNPPANPGRNGSRSIGLLGMLLPVVLSGYLLTGCGGVVQSTKTEKAPAPLSSSGTVLGVRVGIEVEVVTMGRRVPVLETGCTVSAIPPSVKCEEP